MQPVPGVLSTQKACTPGWDSQHLYTGEALLTRLNMASAEASFALPLFYEVGYHPPASLLLGGEGREYVASADFSQVSCLATVPADYLR